MTTTLPPLLTDLDLPAEELQAALLDGDVFRLDRAFCSVAEFDVPWRRASALSGVLGAGHIIARWSAAWVWGATNDPPIRHDVVVARHGVVSGGLAVVSAQIPADDVVDFGGVLATSPTRTVVDLVRGSAWDDAGLAAGRVARLIAEHRVSRAGCEQLLTRSEHLPHVRRARRRLDELGLGFDLGDSSAAGPDAAPRPEVGKQPGLGEDVTGLPEEEGR